MLASCAVVGYISGALVSEIRTSFRLSDAALGLSFAIYWGVAAVVSTPAGHLARRIGPTATLRLAGTIAASAALMIGLFVDSAAGLVALLAVGGASVACANPGVNALIVRAVPSDRRALALGVAQSSPAFGILIAGFAVPALGEPFGWRPVYLGAALLAITLAWTAPRVGRGAAIPAPPEPESASPALRARDQGDGPSLRPLVLVSIGMVCGPGALGAIAAFLVASGPHAEVSTSVAAITLAVGGLLSVPLRIVLGIRADRLASDPLPAVTVLMACGAIGFALLTTQSTALFIPGALIALVFGWGWTGLFAHAILNRYAELVEPATGIMQAGFFAGGILGPLCFGLLAELGSFQLAWLATTVAALLGAATVFLAPRFLPLHRTITPPATVPRSPS